MGVTSYNERSWAIDLISAINQQKTSIITRASGEAGVRGEPGASTLFPDVLLHSQTSIVMGWELKFPDTSVTDHDTITNAKEKARRLGTHAFVLWNVVDAVLYTNTDGTWAPIKNWSLGHSLEREDVEDAPWQDMLATILADVEYLSQAGFIPDRDIDLVINDRTYADVMALSDNAQQEAVLTRARNDALFDAQLRDWVAEVTGEKVAAVTTSDAAMVLAQNLAVNWLNKIVFAHQLKLETPDAQRMDVLDGDTSVDEYLAVFAQLSQRNDFQSIFQPVFGQEIVSDTLLALLNQVNALLIDVTRGAGGTADFSRALGAGLAQLRGKVKGQYATPPQLAELLVKITMTDRRGPAIDPCAGTGTIARAVFDHKVATGDTPGQAASATWASDKFSVPVALAGVALAAPGTMGQVQQVFRADVATLRPGMAINLVDPMTGKPITRELPKFSTIVSNLPFIRFEHLKRSQGREEMAEFADVDLSGKADIYAWIILGLRRLLADNGRIGVIISNSWLASGWGRDLQQLLLEHFNLDALVFSQAQRWFANAEVVATMLVLSPRTTPATDTVIAATTRPIAQWDDAVIDEIATHVLLGRSAPSVEISTVSRAWLEDATRRGLNWTAGLGGQDLIKDLIDVTCLAADWFSFRRGTRSGGEAMTLLTVDAAAEAQIEPDYLRPILHKPADVLAAAPLAGVTSRHVQFQCATPLDELGGTGAADWIARFEHATNTSGRPFPQAINGSPEWYSVKGTPAGDVVTQLNPDQMFGFYRPSDTDVYIGQRFIGMNTDGDVELLHALLNSAIVMLWQEITGFPRGQGVLDRTATSLKHYLRMPDPAQIGDRDRILSAFAPVAGRPVAPVRDELARADRHAFDDAVFAELGLAGRREDVYELMLSLVTARSSVR